MANIEFTTVVEERLEVFLNDVCFLVSIFMDLAFSDQSSHLVEGSYVYTVASVGVLAWFYNPYSVRFISFAF